MTKAQEICTVHLGSSTLDDDYTLYEDGQVRHYYDQNMYSHSHEDWLKAQTLSDDIKKKLLNKCPEELKEKTKTLLYTQYN
ncbi:MAG: hypothetical protein KME60_28430 [Cyanomargarita calcarea GSE-NOS-MK-12-04C]|jgi:hypothetical protein|uniref:Uncharacterized protein n=1 Tax=Cyanomargarita calcarea GSE-NOS-MK-12-04C TaxID=2839659 RepID=A0A951QUM6_9CYAN|nr:hypothetical protein [Cyanomargarita calcarea GSE-NOS-MK-12-04C]